MTAQLLRQPGGFEGLFSRPVLAGPCDLPVANRVDAGEAQRQLRLGAGPLRTSAGAHDHDNRVISRIDDLNRLDSHIIELLDPVLHVSAQCVLAMNRARVIDCTFNRLVVDIVREVFEPPVNPVASKRIGGSLNNSDVLLRHRWLSISLSRPGRQCQGRQGLLAARRLHRPEHG